MSASSTLYSVRVHRRGRGPHSHKMDDSIHAASTSRAACCETSSVKLDFGRPTRVEAFTVTIASLVVSAIFWATSFIFVTNHRTAALVENCIESALDFFTTLLMVYRLYGKDALLPSERNAVIEGRTNIVMGFTLIAIAILNIVNASVELASWRVEDESDVTSEIAVVLPSVILYLIVGLFQLNVAWVLRLRSLKQDAMISILGSVVAMGTVMAGVVNLAEYAPPSRRRRRLLSPLSRFVISYIVCTLCSLLLSCAQVGEYRSSQFAQGHDKRA